MRVFLVSLVATCVFHVPGSRGALVSDENRDPLQRSSSDSTLDALPLMSPIHMSRDLAKSNLVYPTPNLSAKSSVKKLSVMIPSSKDSLSYTDPIELEKFVSITPRKRPSRTAFGTARVSPIRKRSSFELRRIPEDRSFEATSSSVATSHSVGHGPEKINLPNVPYASSSMVDEPVYLKHPLTRARSDAIIETDRTYPLRHVLKPKSQGRKQMNRRPATIQPFKSLVSPSSMVVDDGLASSPIKSRKPIIDRSMSDASSYDPSPVRIPTLSNQRRLSLSPIDMIALEQRILIGNHEPAERIEMLTDMTEQISGQGIDDGSRKDYYRSLEEKLLGSMKFCTMSNGKQFSLKGRLGQGGFGEVYEGEYLKNPNTKEESGCPVIFKVTKDYGAALRELRTFLFLYWQDMDMASKCIAPIYSILLPDDSNEVKILKDERVDDVHQETKIDTKFPVLVYERFDMDLDTYFSTIFKTLSLEDKETVLRWVMRRVFRCLAFLEKYRVIHADLKPGNILVNVNKHTKAIKRLAVADFGCSQIFDYDNLVNVLPGFTAAYYPPEALIECRYTTKADLYSAGCLLADAANIMYVPMERIGVGDDSGGASQINYYKKVVDTIDGLLTFNAKIKALPLSLKVAKEIMGRWIWLTINKDGTGWLPFQDKILTYANPDVNLKAKIARKDPEARQCHSVYEIYTKLVEIFAEDAGILKNLREYRIKCVIGDAYLVALITNMMSLNPEDRKSPELLLAKNQWLNPSERSIAANLFRALSSPKRDVSPVSAVRGGSPTEIDPRDNFN